MVPPITWLPGTICLVGIQSTPGRLVGAAIPPLRSLIPIRAGMPRTGDDKIRARIFAGMSHNHSPRFRIAIKRTLRHV